eukprot:1530102-Amphidinium_carterae.1
MGPTQAGTPNAQPGVVSCARCRAKPTFDGQPGYCSRQCRDADQKAGVQPPSQTGKPVAGPCICQ